MKQILSYLLCYSLWVINGALGFLGMLIVRSVVLKASLTFRLNPWVQRAADKWSFVMVGLVWLMFVVACEGYYREGVSQGKFWPRFARVTGIESFLVGIGYVVHLLI